MLQEPGAGWDLAAWLTDAENAIYLVTALLLAGTAVVLVFSTARNLARSLTKAPVLPEALKALDSLSWR